MSTNVLNGQQVADADLEGWTFLVYYGLFRLETRIHTKDFAAGRQLVNAIAEAAERMDHHADLDLRRSRVDVRLTSGYEVGGVTQQDVQLARRISELAADVGAELECHTISHVELGLDTPDYKKIAPFWAALLDTEPVVGEDFADVGDKNQVLPLIWFQPSGSEEPRQRWHLDVFVDSEQVRPRMEAALAAGGTVVSGTGLADPDGNRVCLCTSQPDNAIASPDATSS